MKKTYDIYVIDGRGFGNIYATQIGEENIQAVVLEALQYSDRIEVVCRRRMLKIGELIDDMGG